MKRNSLIRWPMKSSVFTSVWPGRLERIGKVEQCNVARMFVCLAYEAADDAVDRPTVQQVQFGDLGSQLCGQPRQHAIVRCDKKVVAIVEILVDRTKLRYPSFLKPAWWSRNPCLSRPQDSRRHPGFAQHAPWSASASAFGGSLARSSDQAAHAAVTRHFGQSFAPEQSDNGRSSQSNTAPEGSDRPPAKQDRSSPTGD